MGVFSDAQPILYYMGLSGILKYSLYYWWKDRRPANATHVGHVSELHLYPVKSGRAVDVDVLCCSPERGAYSGPILDRHFMVVTERHDMVTGRQMSLLLSVQCRFEGSNVTLWAKDCDEVTFNIDDVEKSGKIINTNVHGGSTKGLDCGQGVSDWISRYLKVPGHRLVYSSPNIYKRKQNDVLQKDYSPLSTASKEDDLLAFQDSVSFHCCTEESLADLNTRLDKPVKIDRFRPNIVAKTTREPYSEDDWLEVFIGETRFKKVKSCDRCVMPTIDPITCTRDPTNEPTKTLRSYRSKFKGFGPIFGVDLVVERPGPVKVGDPIYVITAAKP